jgi:SAM-dependent methyltransferase
MATGARHLEHPGAVWTAFDRYSRYGALARALRATLGPGRWKVLDVGDGSGYLLAFDEEVDAVALDLQMAADPLPGSVRVIGDGARLPWADRTFDAVVSSDTLEHVPPPARPAFVAELARVSRDVTILAAPFDTPGVAGAEELVRRFALLATSRPQEQLEEHLEHGLPDLEVTRRALASDGSEVVSAGNGNLYDWIQMMLVKHQLLARPALGPLESGYDIAYNALFAGRAALAPFYRHMLVARRAGAGTPQLGTAPEPIAGTPADISGVLGVFAAANVAEAVRQDAEQRLVTLEKQLDELAVTVASMCGTLQESLARLEVTTVATDERLTRLCRVLRHPLQAAGAIRKGSAAP